MPIRQLDLPDAIADAASVDGALQQMRAAQAALDRLADQVTVFSLAELFENLPALDSFSFTLSRESDDEGGSYLSPDVECSILIPVPSADEEPDEEFDEDEALEETREEILEWIDEQTDDWKRAMKNKTFERPANPDLLVETLMARCLSPRAFAAWQASVLQRAAPEGAPSAPRSI